MTLLKIGRLGRPRTPAHLRAHSRNIRRQWSLGNRDMTLSDLREMVKQSDGFLSINSSTHKIEIQNSHVFGRLVVWMRYKLSKSYRASVQETQQKLEHVMTTNDAYGKYFKDKIYQAQSEFMRGGKPISARAVHTFITQVDDYAKEQGRIEREQRRLAEAEDRTKEQKKIKSKRGKLAGAKKIIKKPIKFLTKRSVLKRI